MKNNRFYLSLSMLFCGISFLPLSAQISDATVKVGSEFSPEGYFQFKGDLFHSNNNTGLINDDYITGQKKFFVSGIDDEGRVAGNKTFLEDNLKGVKHGRVFQFNNKSYLVTYEQVKKADGFSLYFQELDFKTQALGQKVLLYSAAENAYGFSTATRVKGDYEVTALSSPVYFDYSTDKSKFVFYYVADGDYKGGKKPTVNFILFDSGLKKVWAKKGEIPYEEFDNIRYVVDSKNNLYVFAKEFIDGRNPTKGKSFNVKYTILKMAAESQSFEKIAIPAGGKYLTRVNFYESADGELFVGGFYMKQTEKWAPDGLAIFEVKNNKAILRVNTDLGSGHAEFVEKMEALRKVTNMVFNANILEYHIKDIKKVSEGRFLVTGFGGTWSGENRWGDFQIVLHNLGNVDTRASGGVSGFNETFPIVMLTDTNKVIWSHGFDNNFVFSDNVNPSFTGFLIDKSNSVFFFNETVGSNSPDSKGKQSFEYDLKKIAIDGKIESQKIADKLTLLSTKNSFVQSIMRKDANHFLIALSDPRGGKSVYKIINVETK